MQGLARILTLTVALGISAALCGCTMMRTFFGPRDPFGAQAVCSLPPNASLNQIVEHLNREQLNSWRATGAKIMSRGPGSVPIEVSAMIAVEAPRNVRLVAQSLAGAEVDLGSNMERFWFWTKRSEPHYLYTARHDQLAQASRKFPIPFQPEWLIDALGVIPLDPNELTLEEMSTDSRGHRHVRLIAERISPLGQPIRKITLVDACHGLVLEHQLVDAQGQIIARAVMSHHYRVALSGDPRRNPSGPVVPNRIDLEWPQARQSFTLTLGSMEINPGQLPAQTFALPNIPGSPVADLGE